MLGNINLILENALGCFYPSSCQKHSFNCNLSDTATKMPDTFACKGAEKHREREQTVNKILWL